MHGFRFYFTLHLESFSPFPHGTCSLSVTREYLALRDGPRRFPQDFTCPVVLGRLFREPTRFRLQGYHLLWPGFPAGSTSVLVFDSPALRRTDPSTPPHASVLGFRLFPFRSPLLRESNFLSLPRGTEMSHFPPLASFRLCIQRTMTGLPPVGFPHSDIPGSKTVCVSPRLIAAYHVLHRLLVPRHPPCTLSSLTGLSKVLQLCIPSVSVFDCQRSIPPGEGWVRPRVSGRRTKIELYIRPGAIPVLSRFWWR